MKFLRALAMSPFFLIGAVYFLVLLIVFGGLVFMANGLEKGASFVIDIFCPSLKDNLGA